MKPTSDPISSVVLTPVVAAAAPEPAARGRKFRLSMIGTMAMIHVVALAAPFVFTWAGLIAFAVTFAITITLGISAGYHRLLVHRGYDCPAWLRYFFSLCGVLAMQGGPLGWCATHRAHHQHSDDDDDPHSPNRGFWWGHMTWFFFSYPAVTYQEAYWKKYAPDLCKDPVLRFMERYFVLINTLSAFALFGLGWAIGGPFTAASVVIWGFFLRIVVAWHATWLVNSAAHMWGYRNYETPDQSRNTWWVALLTSGEGWHNNHHADPRSASHGHKWWEIDPTFTMLRGLETVGLVKNLVRPEGRKTNHAAVGGSEHG